MRKILFIIVLLFIPCLASAEWSTPVWTDDCTITVQKDKDGRITTWTEICRGEDGKQTSKRINTYTYYEKKEVNEINLKVYDSEDALSSERKVKHYTDGKQPTTSSLSIG